MAAPACSIVIRAYNEADHIGRLLDGISQQNVSDLEIVLVDSGSTDETVTVASRYPVRVVHIKPEEFTFGRSLNHGIAQTNSDFIVIASAHVYPVYPDWLEHLLAPFADPKIALVYGRQRGDRSTKFSEQQVFSRWYPESSNPHQKHPFCNNANAAIRRTLWDQHPYDEGLSGLEDLDWASWALDQGYDIAYTAEAEVVHVHNETPGEVYNRYRREAMAFKRIYPQERFGRLDFIRLLGSNIASDLWHAARRGALRSNFSDIFRFRWMQLSGTYRGYRQSGPLTWQLRQTFYYPQGILSAAEPVTEDVEPIHYNDSKERP